MGRSSIAHTGEPWAITTCGWSRKAVARMRLPTLPKPQHPICAKGAETKHCAEMCVILIWGCAIRRVLSWEVVPAARTHLFLVVEHEWPNSWLQRKDSTHMAFIDRFLPAPVGGGAQKATAWSSTSEKTWPTPSRATTANRCGPHAGATISGTTARPASSYTTRRTTPGNFTLSRTTPNMPRSEPRSTSA